MIAGNINIQYKDFELSTGDFRINDGEITVVFGDSGCGKSTLLNCIAGNEKKYTGYINFKKDPVIGYVFQNNSLFPHLNVGENLLYAFSRCRDARYSVEEISKSLSVCHLLKKSIDSLSGGEIKRVSIARAILSSPDILLLDEPLSALHSKAKEGILKLIKSINKKFKLPIVMVTHSMKEVVSLCDNVIYMKRGCPLKQMSREEALFSLDENGPINFISKENTSKLKLNLSSNEYEGLIIHSSNIISVVEAPEMVFLSNSITCTLESVIEIENKYVVLKLKYIDKYFLYSKVKANAASNFTPCIGQRLVALFGPDSHII